TSRAFAPFSSRDARDRLWEGKSSTKSLRQAHRCRGHYAPSGARSTYGGKGGRANCSSLGSLSGASLETARETGEAAGHSAARGPSKGCARVARSCGLRTETDAANQIRSFAYRSRGRWPSHPGHAPSRTRHEERSLRRLDGQPRSERTSLARRAAWSRRREGVARVRATVQGRDAQQRGHRQVERDHQKPRTKIHAAVAQTIGGKRERDRDVPLRRSRAALPPAF